MDKAERTTDFTSFFSRSGTKEKVKLQHIAPGTVWKQAQITVVDSLSGFCVQNWDKPVKERFDRLVQELQ